MNLDVRRQNVSIQLVGLRFHGFEHVLSLLAAEHQDHALDGVIVVLITEFAQPWSVADGHLADVLDANRHAVIAADDNIANVVGVTHQADAAHIVELPALCPEFAQRDQRLHPRQTRRRHVGLKLQELQLDLQIIAFAI